MNRSPLRPDERALMSAVTTTLKPIHAILNGLYQQAWDEGQNRTRQSLIEVLEMLDTLPDTVEQHTDDLIDLVKRLAQQRNEAVEERDALLAAQKNAIKAAYQQGAADAEQVLLDTAIPPFIAVLEHLLEDMIRAEAWEQVTLLMETLTALHNALPPGTTS